MAKKIYSLLLSDDVVEQVDNLAAKQGISRSNMVNRILGEHFSYSTPEKRMHDIFAEVEQLILPHSTMRFSNMPSVSMATIFSALPYRYKPTVRYSVELVDSDGCIARLRVSLRSQNSDLLEGMKRFYALFMQLEQDALGQRTSGTDDSGRFVRLLQKPDDYITDSQIAECITAYINNFDGLMGVYFAQGCSEKSVHEIKRRYAKYLAENIHV